MWTWASSYLSTTNQNTALIPLHFINPYLLKPIQWRGICVNGLLSVSYMKNCKEINQSIEDKTSCATRAKMHAKNYGTRAWYNLANSLDMIKKLFIEKLFSFIVAMNCTWIPHIRSMASCMLLLLWNEPSIVIIKHTETCTVHCYTVA